MKSFFFFQPGTASKLLQTPTSPVPSPPHSPEPVQFFGLLPPLPLSSLTAQSTPSRECPVLPRKLPKRLNIAYFWARTRIVQKACMVSAIFQLLVGICPRIPSTSLFPKQNKQPIKDVFVDQQRLPFQKKKNRAF